MSAFGGKADIGCRASHALKPERDPIGFRQPFWSAVRTVAGTSCRLPTDLALLFILEIRLDRAGELDRQRIAVAILGLADLDANPAFADAIFADIGLLDAFEAYADVALEHVGIVIRAARIVGLSIGRLV